MSTKSEELWSWVSGRSTGRKYTICSFCHGSGKVRKKTCPVCEGFGVVPTSSRRYWGGAHAGRAMSAMGFRESGGLY